MVEGDEEGITVIFETLLAMKRTPLLQAIFLPTVIAIEFFLLSQPSFAAEDECSSDTGIPYGVIAPIDVGHVRKTLAESGISVGGFYLGETFGNTGGIRQGETYDGVLWTYLLSDLHKAGLWKGLCFYADSYQIHGRSITADNIGSLATVSNYEAMPSTSLSELWLEQHLFNDHLTFRIGQLTADTEFLLSSGGSNFLNSTWGWATLPSFDLPGGGPAYPHATPGVRVALKPNDKWNLMLGLYNGDPELDSPLLLMVEGRYNYNQGGRLPGTVKIGGWNQFGTLHDQLFASTTPTVTMTSNSVPINSDWAIYGIVDQRVWRAQDSKDASGIGLFGRVIAAPAERTLIGFYADGGIAFSGMIPHRTNDILAVGLAYTGISSAAHDLDINSGLPVARTQEVLAEVCYTAKLIGGWTFQPDFQYIWRPGGGVPEPSGKGRVENAAVWGVRTIINF